MRIIVCVKQVPSTTEVHPDPVTNTLIRDARHSVINPFDLHALEEAVRLKERMGGEVVVLSMGIPATEKLLRDAICRGADRAVLLTDRKFAGADTLATSYTLSLGVKEIGQFDLVLCGKMAVDGDTAQIGPELAEVLSIPHVTEVTRILEANEQSLTCTRTTDDAVETLKVTLPALLTVTRDINMPRLPSIAGIKDAQGAELSVFGAGDLTLEENRIGLEGSPTQVVRTFVPPKRGTCEMLDGSPSDQAKRLLDIVRGSA